MWAREPNLPLRVKPRGLPAERILDLESPIRFLKGVGPVRANRLAQAGFMVVRDLLDHLPRRFEDWRTVLDPGDVVAAGAVAVRAKLWELRPIRTRNRRLVLIRARAVGERGSLPVLWFNQSYLLGRLEEGKSYLLYGMVRHGRGATLELHNPACTLIEEGEPVEGRIVPIYESLAGFGPAGTRRLITQAVDLLQSLGLPDPLPEELRLRYRFPELSSAYLRLHRPASGPSSEALIQREGPEFARLAYQELLQLQLELAWLRHLQIREPKGHSYIIDLAVRRRARELLPFPLTGAQKRALREIAQDLISPYPMLRLLQGDVGSGKTIVAAMALFLAAASGVQGAFMAPTELLAEQHFRSLQAILGSQVRVALLTASSQESARIREQLATGEISVVVGTHALVQSEVRFRCLALAVIDEQHRFGVEQRQLLQRKGDRPDVLVMTATPIPRTLAYTIYGDLALSMLDELPPGRAPVLTELVSEARRETVYRDLARELKGGARAFVVLPKIEEGELESVASIEREGHRIQELLLPAQCAVVHGKLQSEERAAIMDSFLRGEVQVLIATTVIEVGVDVPEATWMVIESAERFGLAQLHQLRGRVGRGLKKGRCVAIHGRLNEASRMRLEAFVRVANGFDLALLDLELRGPGDLLGTRQSGLPTLRLADLIRHQTWLERARQDAAALVERAVQGEELRIVELARQRAAIRLARFGGG